MIPTACHFGKGNTVEIVKRSVVARGFWGEKDEWVEHKGLWGP